MAVRSIRPRLLLHRTALAATLALMGPYALAQVSSMVATGSYAFDGGTATALSNVDPGNDPVNVLVFPSASDTGSSAGLHSYGSSTGDFGSRSSGMGVYQVNGGFKLVESITNTSAVAQAATFTFAITPGLLQNSIGAALGAGQYVEAGLNFNVSVGGSSVWNSAASLRSDSSGTSFSSSGDSSLYAGFGTTYNVLGVSRDVDLGVINAGQTIELSYELTTFANGVSTAGPDRYVPPTTFTVPDGWYVYSQCGYGYGGYGYGCGYLPPGTVVDVPGYTVPGTTSGSQASSGDPFFVSFGPTITASGGGGNNVGTVTLSAVPEPASGLLMLGGLAGLAWAKRRRA